MKIKTTLLALTPLAAIMAAPAMAADANTGTVTFTGEILDTPCSISGEDSDQIIDLGSISKASLNAENNSPETPVKFSLVGCELDATNYPSQTMDIAFSGAADATDATMLQAGDTGAVIRLSTYDNQMVSFDGTSTATLDLVNGNNEVELTAWVQKNGVDVTEGSFTQVTHFTFTYN